MTTLFRADATGITRTELRALKGKAVSGGLAKLAGQGTNLVVKLCYLMILARLLTPGDFGLIAMASVITGIFDYFTSAGLSSAAVQRASITRRQISQLFWINLLVGCILTLLCAASAWPIARFYSDQRLLWVTLALAPGFLINAAGVQHSAILQRELRYTTLSVIDTGSQLASAVVGVVLAVCGYGYWALAVASLVVPCFSTASCWLTATWLPERPRRNTGIGPLLRYGGVVTLNSITVYIGYNLEKVLLGRFWGPSALGLYGRAIQLANLPAGNINAAVGGVFFSALARLQGDPARFRSFFLNGYSMVMAVAMPATLFPAVFAKDVVTVFLGAKWEAATPIFQCFVPAVLVFTIINPLAWVLMPLGLQKRSLYVGLVLAPLAILACLAGLPHGPTGVALCYSVVMLLWLFPHVTWCLHRTPITVGDLCRVVAGPLTASIGAALLAFGFCSVLAPYGSSAMRLLIGAASMMVGYGGMLLMLTDQRRLYVNVISTFRA